MKRRDVILDMVFAALMFIAVSVYLIINAVYRLEFKEQISIFMLGADRIGWYFSNPGFIATISGDWLTQFYISGVGAVSVSALLLAVLLLGLDRFFRLAEPERPVLRTMLMIPVVLGGYFLTFPNYPVSAIVGLIFAVWVACALLHLKDSRWSSTLYGLCVPVMFVFAGGNALALAILLAYSKRKEGIWPILYIVIGLIVMMICGRFYNLTLLQTFLWPVYPGYIIPGKILLLSEPLIIIVVAVLSSYVSRIVKTFLRVSILTVFMLGSVSFFVFSDEKELEGIVKIGTLAYREQWDDVKQYASSHESNRYSSFYWNLCNAREGHLAEGLLKGRWGPSVDGLFLLTGRGAPYFSMIYYPDALLEMGDVSQATDCALLAQTIMPGRYSSRMLRRLAEIAVVTGDYNVAIKYLDILSRTRNHRDWAENLKTCIIEDTLPIKYIAWRSRTIDNDHFFLQGDIRSSLGIIASESPYNKIAIDYLLCSFLLDKDVPSFVKYYDKYYLNSLDQVVDVPKLYQEALIATVSSMDSFRETVEKYNINSNVYEKFMRVMEVRANSENPDVLPREAAGSYWNYLMAVRYNNN